MRKELRDIGTKERHRFTAEFVRYGVKSGWVGDIPTVLFKNIKLDDKIVCDHLWFTCGKQFDSLNLVCGDIIEFSARVDSYLKGYMGYRDDVWDKPIERDWKLSFPTKIRKIGKNESPEIPVSQRPKEGESNNSLDIHAQRVEEARKRLRLKPPQYLATFVDCSGKELCTVNSVAEIISKVGISESQWECFFKGLVGSLSKGDEISLRFVKRRKSSPVPPYYQYGVKMERTNRHGQKVVEGYGFIRASYIVGWKEHSPYYVAHHRKEFDGGTFGKQNETLTYMTLGNLSQWEMRVIGTEYWKNKYEERLGKISKERENSEKQAKDNG